MFLIKAAFFTMHYFVGFKYEFDFISTDSDSDSYETTISFAAASTLWGPQTQSIVNKDHPVWSMGIRYQAALV